MNGRGIEYSEGVNQSVTTNILDVVKRFHSSRNQAPAKPASSSVKQPQPVDALPLRPGFRLTTPDHSRALLTGVNSYSFQQHNCKTSTAQPSLIGDYYFRKSQQVTRFGMLHAHWCGRCENSRGYIFRRGYGSGEYSIGFQQCPPTFPNTAMSSLRDFVGSRALKWQISYGSVDSEKIHGNDI